MATGDDAVAAGMTIMTGAELANTLDTEINLTRDYIAQRSPAVRLVSGGGTGATTASAARTNLGIPTWSASDDPNTLVSRNSEGKASIADPTGDMNIANKRYVDAQVAGSSSSLANGPTSTAYNRGATGSGWFATWMNSSNQFMRSTSSRRYKKNIRNWGGSVLGLRAVIFDRRGKDTPNDEVGFIAEEVLETLPEAVAWFDGKVDGIQDRAIIAALVADVQRLAARVKELESRD